MRKLFSFILLYLLVSAANAQHGSWRPIGPYEGTSSGRIYTGPGGWMYYLDEARNAGLFRSSDYGKSWDQPARGTMVSSFAVDGIGGIYASFDGRIELSTDHGNSWIRALDTPAVVSSVLSSPNGEWIGVLHSVRNATVSRYYLRQGIGPWNVRDIRILRDYQPSLRDDGSLLFVDADSLSVLSSSGVARTVGPLPKGQFFVKGDSLLFTAWERSKPIVLRPPFDSLSQVIPVDHGRFAMDSMGFLYCAAGGYGVFRSVNNGVTWDSILDLSHRSVITSLETNGNGDLFLSLTDRPIFRFRLLSGEVDTGAIGINVSPVTEVYPTADSTIVTGVLKRGTLMTSNGGVEWKRVGPYDPGSEKRRALAVTNAANPTIWVTDSWYKRRLFLQSTNLGSSWDTVRQEDAKMLTVAGDRVIASFGYPEVLLRFDVDQQFDILPVRYSSGDEITLMPGGEIALGVNLGVSELELTTDNGDTWTPFGLPSGGVRAMTLSNGIALANSDGLLRSTDRGKTWKGVRAADRDALLQSTANGWFYLYLQMFSGVDAGLHVSRDGGSTWTKILPLVAEGAAEVYELKIDNFNRVVAATSRGVYIADVSLPQLAVELQHDAGSGVRLIDDGVLIHEREDLRAVHIYDVVGRELLQGTTSRMDVSSLRPGVYLLRSFSATGEERTGRVMIMR